MIRRSQRFRNHLDDNLIHLHKNLFISPSDPMYHEKVIRYLDATSPEAHYKIGQNFKEEGISNELFFITRKFFVPTHRHSIPLRIVRSATSKKRKLHMR